MSDGGPRPTPGTTDAEGATEASAESGVRAWLGIYLRGVCMGAADAVPGVSGGTIALITGIYERLIDAVATLPDLVPGVLAALGGDGPPGTESRGRTRSLYATLVGSELPFLGVLGLGVLTGALSLATIAEHALAVVPALTYAFFFGLILASPLVIRGEVGTDPASLGAGLFGAAVAFVVSGLPRGDATVSLPVLALVGAVAICAMVLPGVSGSLLLLTLGQYDTMTGAVSDLLAAVRGLVGGGDVGAFVEPTTVLATFGLGAAVGLLTFARAVSWAIDHYRTATMTLLVGVMIGALRAPARGIAEHVDVFTLTVVAGLLVVGLAGALAVVGLEYVTTDLEY